MRKLLTCFCIQFLLWGNFANGQTLHTIMYITDEMTDPIYSSCQKDKKLMTEEIKKIEKLTGLEAKFYSTNFTKQNLQSVISRMSVKEDDVIMFYYSGHGYNRGNSEFPCMNFRESSFNSTHVSLYETHQRLKQKGARFLLTIGDLCNNIAKSKYGTLLTGRERSIGYTKLFMQYKGDIIITSSEKSQYSFTAPNGGGSHFTLAFLDALHSCINNGDYYWSLILKKAKTKTVARNINQLQVPYYKMNIELVRQGNTSAF